jgi:hypothetical protein
VPENIFIRLPGLPEMPGGYNRNQEIVKHTFEETPFCRVLFRYGEIVEYGGVLSKKYPAKWCLLKCMLDNFLVSIIYLYGD